MMSNDEKDLKHKKMLAKAYDKYREDYKQKLNPQTYPGNMSLIFELDTRVCVVTTGDITYVGELSSFDPFGNITLAKASTREFGVNGPEPETKLDNIFIKSDVIVLIGKVNKAKENELLNIEEEEEDQ